MQPFGQQLRLFLAEYLATALLIGFGTGAVVVNDTMGQPLGHIGIACAFGLAVMMIISGFGHVSGAHANPAVTIGFFVARRFPGNLVPLYITAQLLGASSASLIIYLLMPAHPNLGATLPSSTWTQAFFLEIILTFALMLVIMQVSTGAKEKGIIAALAIGGTVGLEALVAGPVCGASMNPARSFGPALIAQVWTHQWLYVVAPCLGAVLAIGAWSILRTKEPL
jgi:aquaporin NIP